MQRVSRLAPPAKPCDETAVGWEADRLCAQFPAPPTPSPPGPRQQLCPLAKQGEESRGRNGPPAASHTSLVCSAGAIFLQHRSNFLQRWRSQFTAIPRLQWTGGSGVWHLFSRPCFDGVLGALFKLGFLSLSFAVHAAGQGIYKRSPAAGDIQSRLGATRFPFQSCLGLTFWADERASEQTIWHARVRRGVRGGGRMARQQRGPRSMSEAGLKVGRWSSLTSALSL